MQGIFAQGRFVWIFLCVLLFVLSACSMQNPDSRFESSKSNATKEPASFSSDQGQQQREKNSLRVDYLTAVSDIANPEIFIYKQKRRLYVIQSNVMVRDYPVGLGSCPAGDKEKEGDGRTPEGDFLIRQKDPVSPFKKALILNYPDRKHAERALFTGIISAPEFKEIMTAAESKEAPFLQTKLGGRFYIHAGGAQRDWTQGSIALYNSDMEELYKIASAGTPVHIRP